jgi:guanylate kinase
MSKLVVTVTGPSASGKSELLTELCANHNFERLISVTTRPPREGEKEGVEYYYITEEEFARQREAGNLLQEVCFNGKYYGTTKKEVDRVFVKGKVPIVIVEPGGVKQFEEVGESMGFTLYSVFVHAPFQVLQRRFLARLKGAEPTEYDLVRLKAIENEALTWPTLADWDAFMANAGASLQDIQWLAADLTKRLQMTLKEMNNG